MTKNQACKFLEKADFKPAADVLGKEWTRLEALRKEKQADWPLGEAIQLWEQVTGGTVNKAMAGRIKATLGPLVEKTAAKHSISPADAWIRVKGPYSLFAASEDARYGIERFGANPRLYAAPASSRAQPGYKVESAQGYLAWVSKRGGYATVRDEAENSGLSAKDWAAKVGAPVGTIGYLRL